MSRHSTDEVKRPSLKRKMWILVINFQSLRSKRESFRAMLEYSEPDIVLASETWFTPSITEREALPESYRFVLHEETDIAAAIEA